MRKENLRLYILVFGLLLLKPATLTAQYDWRPKACLPGIARNAHTTFSVGGKGYVVGGLLSSFTVTDEVWMYDPATNTWTKKRNFPAGARAGQCSFVINGVAYVGLGSPDNINSYVNEFFRYDNLADTWVQVASFPGSVRYFSMTFVLNGKGYVGCGKGVGQNNDFYEYDPVSNQWAQKESFPGSARQNGMGVMVGGYGYMGLGFDGSSLSDVYRYDAGTDTWAPVANFGGTGRYGPGYFVINDTAYVAGGRGPYTDDCWRYDVGADSWTQQESFTCLGPPRSGCFGFAINRYGYILGGDLNNGQFFFRTLFQFGPDDPTFTDPVNILGNDTSYCGNFSRVLRTGNDCTKWSTGATGAQITVNTFGTYWANYPDTCGMKSDTIHLTQSSTVAINIGADTAYCGQFTRTLSTGDASTIWSTGVTGPQITVSTAGTYWATINNACSVSTDTLTLTQKPLPVVDLGNDTSLCFSQVFVIDASNTNSTYHWQDNSTNPTFNVSADGIYAVTVTNSQTCSASDSIKVSFGSPKLDLGTDRTVCSADELILNAAIPGGTYQWQDNSTSNNYRVTTSGTYSVTVSNNCGTATDQVTLEVLHDDCKLLIPTAFSPNQDGMNDLFRISSYCPVQSYHLKVYNRWGQLVFESTSVTDSWDGTYKDLPQPLSVFVYEVQYYNYCEKKIKTVAGNVTLVK